MVYKDDPRNSAGMLVDRFLFLLVGVVLGAIFLGAAPKDEPSAVS